jgi:hypothetical protein
MFPGSHRWYVTGLYSDPSHLFYTEASIHHTVYYLSFYYSVSQQ